jgi:hypothetical protein
MSQYETYKYVATLRLDLNSSTGKIFSVPRRWQILVDHSAENPEGLGGGTRRPLFYARLCTRGVLFLDLALGWANASFLSPLLVDKSLQRAEKIPRLTGFNSGNYFDRRG